MLKRAVTESMAVVHHESMASKDDNELVPSTVSILRQQLGLRCFELQRAASKLLGLCLDFDTFEELADNTVIYNSANSSSASSSSQTPKSQKEQKGLAHLLSQSSDDKPPPPAAPTYCRWDVGDGAWQLAVWEQYQKVLLPDHLDLRPLSPENETRLYLLEVNGGPGFNPVDGEALVENRLLCKNVTEEFKQRVRKEHEARRKKRNARKTRNQVVVVENNVPDAAEDTGVAPDDRLFLSWVPIETKNKNWNDIYNYTKQHALHPEDKIIFFKPCAELVFRTPDHREILNKEAVFTHLLFVESLLLGCRLEIDRQTGTVLHESKTVRSELDVDAHNKVLGRKESAISKVRRTFLRAITKRDAMGVGKPGAVGSTLDASSLEKWVEETKREGVAANWEVGPINLRRTEDIKRRVFSQDVPTCSRGHSLFLQTYQDVRWSEERELPCRVCGRLQTYGMETCKRRCEFYGICENCADEWKKIDEELKESHQQSLKREKLYSRVDLQFPIVAPDVNPVSFIRFQVHLNFRFQDYLRNPFECDTRLLNELGELFKEAGILEPGVPAQLLIVGAADQAHGLQTYFDVMLVHPRFKQLISMSRHFRTAFAKTPGKQWLAQNSDLFGMFLKFWAEMDRLQKDTLAGGKSVGVMRDGKVIETSGSSLSQAALSAKLKEKYPLLSASTKFVPQQAVACRGGFDDLLHSQPLKPGEKPKKKGHEEVPRELIPLQRMVACPMQCGVDMVDHQLAIHKLKLCKKRNAECELGCGAKLVYEDMEKHCGIECPNRGVICPMCHEVVLAKDLPAHGLDCTHRPTQCNLCGVEFPLILQPEHDTTCPQRQVDCNWCYESVIAAALFKPHKTEQCTQRYRRARELSDAIYMCRPAEEVQQNFLDDGVLPTDYFTDAEKEAYGGVDANSPSGGNSPTNRGVSFGGSSTSPTLVNHSTPKSTRGAGGFTTPNSRSLLTSSPTSGSTTRQQPFFSDKKNSIDCELPPLSKSNFVGLALHAAALVDNVELCELFLKRGADLYAVDSFGRTALHIAAAHGSDAVLDLLLVTDSERATSNTKETLPDMRDAHGRTALFLAGFHQRKVCVDLLYDVSPYTPRTMKQCESLLNVLRYDERKEKTFSYLKHLAPSR
ncbi:unnamed protein product [Amoebophrya sp. A120]|nr:unnamed protein product [Amoebophrya sp. A120]|eukprot:GSA120T00022877001.1